MLHVQIFSEEGDIRMHVLFSLGFSGYDILEHQTSTAISGSNVFWWIDSQKMVATLHTRHFSHGKRGIFSLNQHYCCCPPNSIRQRLFPPVASALPEKHRAALSDYLAAAPPAMPLFLRPSASMVCIFTTFAVPSNAWSTDKQQSSELTLRSWFSWDVNSTRGRTRSKLRFAVSPFFLLPWCV